MSLWVDTRRQGRHGTALSDPPSSEQSTSDIQIFQDEHRMDILTGLGQWRVPEFLFPIRVAVLPCG